MNKGLRKELSLLTGVAAAGLWLARKNGWATALGLCAAGLNLLPGTTYSYQGKSVIITGGSRGLGFALARRLLQEGAYVALLARDEAELDRAKVRLEEDLSEGKVMTVPCDVTLASDLMAAFHQVTTHFEGLDVLVNCAGSISVGPFESMDQDDFDAQINLQLHAVIYATRLAVPEFRRRGEGRIINICSIGGDLPVPHMSTYCAAKFAMSGLSETITAELAPDNIKVTTVYPGLMRTGSPIQAVFKGDHEKEYGWFAAGDVMPGISVAPEYAAKKILEGARNGDAHVRFPWVTKAGMVSHALFPETYAFTMRQVARFLPKGQSIERKTGAQSQAWLERQFWYKPLQGRESAAEAAFNQVEKTNAEFNLGLSGI